MAGCKSTLLSKIIKKASSFIIYHLNTSYTKDLFLAQDPTLESFPPSFLFPFSHKKADSNPSFTNFFFITIQQQSSQYNLHQVLFLILPSTRDILRNVEEAMVYTASCNRAKRMFGKRDNNLAKEDFCRNRSNNKHFSFGSSTSF